MSLQLTANAETASNVSVDVVMVMIVVTVKVIFHPISAIGEKVVVGLVVARSVVVVDRLLFAIIKFLDI